MAATAELTLILKAQNLANIEFDKIKAGMEKITVTAKIVAGDVAAAFQRIGRRIAGQFGNVAQDILSGGNLTTALATVGITMAGALVEGLMAHLIPSLLTRLAGTATFAPIIASLTAEGLTLGGVLSAALGVGMAALPFILAAAAVAALVYLISNPEAREKVRGVALMILGKIGDGLKALPGLLGGIFVGAWNLVTGAVGAFVTTVAGFWLSLPGKVAGVGVALVKAIIGGLISLPGKLADVVREAFKKLNFVVGPFHITGSGITIDLPHINTSGYTSHIYQPTPHAAGGWAGLNGPELSLLGEKGPEYVRRAGTGTGDGGGMTSEYELVPVRKRDIARMVDEQIYYMLQRAAPTLSRS